MPALQPPDIWQQSGRYETMRDALYKVRDRAKKEWVLGPTHEEVITTLAAAEITERVCYGMELDPKYVDVDVQRWQKLAGGQAVLDGDGRTFAEIAEERRKEAV